MNLKDKVKFLGLIFLILITSFIAYQWRDIYFYLISTQKARMIIKNQSDIVTAQGKIVFDSSRNWKAWSSRDIYILDNGSIKKVLQEGTAPHFIKKTSSVMYLGRTIHINNLNTGEIRSLNIQADISPISGYDLSPDGQQIVFIGNQQGKQGMNIKNIYIVNVDGAGLKQVTFFKGEYFFGYPRWSPDGKQILFNKGDTERNKPINWGGVNEVAPSLYVINVDGTGLKNLFYDTETFGWHGSWSNNGRLIVFTVLDETGLDQIAIFDLLTNKVNQITKIPLLEDLQINKELKEDFQKKINKGYPLYKDFPRFSPDDTHIAFVGKSRGSHFHSGSELFMTDVNGGKIQRLTVPHWTRMGWSEIDSFDWAA